MFGNVIYYDKNKIDEYRAVVKGQRNLQIVVVKLFCNTST